jgi:hypothetical protein
MLINIQQINTIRRRLKQMNKNQTMNKHNNLHPTAWMQAQIKAASAPSITTNFMSSSSEHN